MDEDRAKTFNASSGARSLLKVTRKLCSHQGAGLPASGNGIQMSLLEIFGLSIGIEEGR